MEYIGIPYFSYDFILMLYNQVTNLDFVARRALESTKSEINKVRHNIIDGVWLIELNYTDFLPIVIVKYNNKTIAYVGNHMYSSKKLYKTDQIWDENIIHETHDKLLEIINTWTECKNYMFKTIGHYLLPTNMKSARF